jgi:hypothetical protein
MRATTRRFLETSIVTGQDESREKFRERATFQFDEAASKKNAPLAARAEQGRASLLNDLRGMNY